MMKFLFGALAAASLATSANAAMLTPPVSNDTGVVQVYGGCGVYAHRGPYGGCRPGGQAGGYGWGRACPPGFHLGPEGRRCWPN
ncbi:MAG TPA: hypothetical protein VKS78_17410 [Roseiarcus sp.]|nr:hypothetical protein [Roseiarcus sp.]